MWIAIFGAGIAGAALILELPEFDNVGMLLLGIGVFCFGIGESTCHKTQQGFIPAERMPSGYGATQFERPVRVWTTEGKVLYTIGAVFLIGSIVRLLLA